MDASTGMIAKTLGGIGAAGAVSTAATAGVIYAAGSNGEGEKPTADTTLDDLKTKLNSLGITDNCQDDATGKTRTCTLDGNKLKGLFHVLEGSNTATATIDPSSGANITLRAEKTTKDTDIFSEGFKFTIFSSANIEVQKSNDANSKITIKKNTNTEFKINTSNKLEKAWDAAKLGAKVGLTCGNNEKCSTTANGVVNVKNDNSNKTIGAKLPASPVNEKIEAAKNTEGYNQGFKFTVKNEPNGITLTGGSNEGTQITNLAKDASYEIKNIDGKWFLVKGK